MNKQEIERGVANGVSYALANLTETNLIGENLTEADLTGANLSRASFANVLGLRLLTN